MKKKSVKNKFLTLAILATVLGGSAFMPKVSAEMNWTLADPTGSTYKNSIALTGVSQATKNGDITLGNQINFGTYKQSLKTGSFSTAESGSNHDARYSSATGATFNVDPVAWIVVKDNGSNKYTLVSTKVLDGGKAWNPSATATGTPGQADSQNWEKMTGENTLRYYMNNTMYTSLTEGMSDVQKGLIQDSEITTYKATSGETGYNGWDSSTTELSTSTDKLYLMSVQELKEWFAGQSNTNPQYGSGKPYPGGASASGKVPWGAGATDYAKSTGIWIETEGGVTAVDGTLNAYYYLRSPSSYSADRVRDSSTTGAVYHSTAPLTTLGSRPALQINLSSLIFTSKSSYGYKSGTSGETEYKSGKGSAAVGGDAVKLGTIGNSDTLDLTLYDVNLGTVTTATTLELTGDDIKLGYSGSGTDKSVAGMLATGDSTGYTPVAWGRLAENTASGTGILGLGNVDANTEYSLLIFNEQGTGTSFIGDANTIGKVKKVSDKSELDITGSTNIYSGDIMVGSGNKLTAKASQLTGDSTVTSTNEGTIILKDTGTVAMNITNSGTVEFAAGAGNTITVSGKVIGGTVNVTSGMMKYTNPSTTDKIGSVLNISSGAALDPDAGTLADNTTNNGDLYLSGGTLSVDIGGTGTTYLKANPEATSVSTVTVHSDRNIAGKLDGSNGTIKMTGDNALTTLTIGTLTGTTNLQIDVDMSEFTADKLAVGTITGATVNVSGINITKDIVLTDNTLMLPVDGNNEITYVTDSTIGTAGDATYQVGGATDGTVVVTNNYKYIFSKGTQNGTLKYRAEAGDLTFKKFVEGTLSGYDPDPATLSLTADLANTGADIATITMGSNQSNAAITVNLNGHDLSSATASTVTINSGKTFNLDGGSAAIDGTVDANTGFSVAGTMNISGKTTMNGTLDGAGAYTNSGTLTVANAANLAMNGANGLANTGTLNLGNATSSALGANISGNGITNVNGFVTSDKNIANSVNVTALTGDFTVNGGEVSGAVTNSNNMTVSGGSVSGTITNSATLNVSGGSVKLVTNTGTMNVTGVAALTEDITNTNGTVNFNADGTLATGSTITGGSVNIAADVEANANDFVGTKLTVGDSKTLTLSGGTLAGTVNVNGGSYADTGTLAIKSGSTVVANTKLNYNVDNDGTLTTAATNVVGAVDNEGGTLNLDAGELGTSAVISKGIVDINGDVKVNANNFDATNKVATLNVGAGGVLNMVNNVVPDVVQVGTFTAAEGSKIALDVDLSGVSSATPGSAVTLDSDYDIIKVTGNATGTLKLGTGAINVVGATPADTDMAVGAYAYMKIISDADGNDLGSGSDITFGDSVAVTSDAKKFVFSQAHVTPTDTASDKKTGYIQVKKDYGYNLAQIVNNNHAYSDAYEPGLVDTYVLVNDLTLTDTVQVTAGTSPMVETNHYGLFESGADTIVSEIVPKLGSLTPAESSTTRELTINGNNHKLLAKGTGVTGEYSGLIVDTGNSLTINNVSEISGFSSHFVNNTGGTVNIGNTGTNTTKLDSVLKGSGIYNNSGTLIVADASNLAMTNGLVNTGTVKLGGDGSTEMGTNLVIKGGNVEMKGAVTFGAANLDAADRVNLTATAVGTSMPIYNFTVDSISGSIITLGDTLKLQNATGTIKLGGLASLGTVSGTWEVGEYAQVQFADLAGDLTVGEGTQFTLDGYKYDFSQAYNIAGDSTSGYKYGWLDVTKALDCKLWQAVRQSSTAAGKVATYVLTANYAAEDWTGSTPDAPADELGTLGTSSESGQRGAEFTIDGRNYTFKGSSDGGTTQYKGITVTGGTLTLKDISEISLWNEYVVNNTGGMVNISNTGSNTTALNSKLTGAGAYTNTGKLTVADAANLAMTGTEGLKNTGTLTLGGGTLSAAITDDATTATGITVIDGDVTATNAITQNNLTINADKKLTMNGGTDKNLTITNAVDNKGTLIIGASELKSSVTNGGTVTLKEGTLAEGKTITGGTVKITEDVSTISTNLLDGSGNNMNVQITDGKTLTITGDDLTVAIGDSTNNKGTVKFTGTTGADKEIYAAVEVGADEGALTVAANLLKNERNTNYGTLTFTGDNKTLGNSISGSGRTYVDGSVTVAEGKSITQSVLTINSGRSLTAEVDALTIGGGTGSITNEGTLTLTADGVTDDLMYESVTGGTASILNFNGNNKITANGAITQGTVNVNTDVDMNAALTAAVNVAGDKTLTIGAGNLKGDVANSGIVALKDGTLESGYTITGGKIAVDGAVAADVGDLLSNAGITANTGSTLTLTGTGELIDNITGAGNVTVGNGTDDAAVIAALAKFGNTGDLTVAANGTLVTGGELNRDIKGTGTVQLNADANLANGKNIEGTLDGNGKSVTIGAANSIDSFTVGKLANTTNLKLDVDMSNFTSDMIVVTDFEGSAVVSGINIIKDYAEGASELVLPKASTSADEITYLEKSGGSGTTSVQNAQIVVTNNYKYTFTAGGVGKLAYRVDASDLTFKKFMEGTLGEPSPTTLSLTDDLENIGTDIGSISQGPDNITINLNGHELGSASESNITVGSGKILNLNGDGTVDGNTNFIVDGDMNITDEVTMDGTLAGAGNYTNSGTLNIADAFNLQMTNGLTNNGTLNLTEGTLGADILGEDGEVNINGDVTSAKNIANAVNVADAGNLTNSGNMGGAVTNAGTLTNTGTISGAVTNSGDMTTTANGITGGVTNNNNLILTGGDLGSAITGTGSTNITGAVTNSNGKGITQDALTIASGGALTTNADALVIDDNAGTITNKGNLTLTGGTLQEKLIDATGSLTIDGDVVALNDITQKDMTINDNKTLDMATDGKKLTVTDPVDNKGTLSIGASDLLSKVNNDSSTDGEVILRGGTLADGSTITGGAITTDGDVTANVNDLLSDNGITNQSPDTLTLTGTGALADDILGDGTTKIDGNITSDREINNTLIVNSSKNFTNSGTVYGPVTNNGIFTNSGSVDGDLTNSGTFDNTNGTLEGQISNNAGGTLTTKLNGISNWDSGNVSNSGILNIIDGGALNGQNITNTGGTINLSGDYTMDWANAASGLNVAGGSVDASGSTLTLTGMTKENKDKEVKLLNLTNGATATGKWAALEQGRTYNMKTDGAALGLNVPLLKSFTIDEDGNFVVLAFGSNFVPMDSVEDGIRTSAYSVANAMAESSDGNITNFIDAISDMEGSSGTAAAAEAFNASMNIGEAGGVQHGTISMVGYIGEAIGNNMSIISRPILESTKKDVVKKAEIKKVANDGDAENAKIEEIPVAKADEIMPVAHNYTLQYEKTIWASYMHNKENIDGLQLDGVKQNGTAQYNGTTVGADLWSSGKVIGGVAIAYSTGDVNSTIGQAQTKNEVKYYGVSVYNRWTNGMTGILADVGYMHANNELTQSNAGDSDLTADAKVNSFTAGVRAEQLVKLGRSNLVPFAGVRYMHLRNGEYTLSVDGSNGQHFAPKNQNIITPQVGVAWNGEFTIPGSKWTFRPSVEAGYLWNLGDRDTESLVSFGGANDTIGYEVADKSSYFAKLGMDFRKDNVILGVSFKYQKGDAVKNRKWNFNVNFIF